ncbi:hypothetical protein ACTXT7_012897 [Hymenolepis weldensis]
MIGEVLCSGGVKINVLVCKVRSHEICAHRIRTSYFLSRLRLTDFLPFARIREYQVSVVKRTH